MKRRFSKRKMLKMVVAILLLVLLLLLNPIIGLLLISPLFVCGIVFYAFNSAIKKTNWYKNLFLYTNQFITNWGYREDLRRNFSIVNVGSNPALYAFEYDENVGQNWATGSQGPEMDLEILKYYHSYIKEGGIVLLPIVPFSSCTPYLWHYKQNFLGEKYYARFAKVLESGSQARKVIPNYERILRWIKYPFLYSPCLVKLLIKDVPLNNKKLLKTQQLGKEQLQRDAEKWVNRWKKEFDIKDLDENLDEVMIKCQSECVDVFVEIIRFCKERNLKPVLIIPPITKYLNSCFTEKMKNMYIYSFIRSIQIQENVKFLDYMTDKDFEDPGLYFNSFFLNSRGRIEFTNRVLDDLNVR